MNLENSTSLLPHTTTKVSGRDSPLQPPLSPSLSPAPNAAPTAARIANKKIHAPSSKPKAAAASHPQHRQQLPTSIPRTTTSTLHFARASKTQPSDNVVRLATELVNQRNIGQYGLTAATVLRDQSSGAASSSNILQPENTSSPVSSGPPTSRPAHAWKPPEIGTSFVRPRLVPPDRKRSVGTSNIDSVFRIPAKRPRRLPPGWIDLGHIVPPQTLAQARPLANGVSPLFFSRSTRPSYMPTPSPNFSAAEPAGAMLTRLREEPDIVRTVKLPRGHASSSNLTKGQVTNTPGSVTSDTLSSLSGESRYLPPELRDLQGLSVVDLLEADERPTFIIDLAKSANSGPGPLKLSFVNAALRASQGIHELILQSTEDNIEFSRFKAWAVSFVRKQKSMDVNLPSLSYGGITWTCSTLSNRFRFVSGSASAVSMTPTSPEPPTRATSVLEERSRSLKPAHETHTPGRERALSDVDYFGDTQSDPPASTRRAQSEPRDLADLRPATPVVEFREPDTEHAETEFIQTHDWTRISDTSGKSPLSFFHIPFPQGGCKWLLPHIELACSSRHFLVFLQQSEVFI